MKVIVTGASGYIGRAVVDELMAQGIETVALGRTAPTHTPGLRFVHADLLAGPAAVACAGQLGGTHLLHLAWYAEHGKFWASPANLDWVSATLALVSAFVAGGGSRVVVAGTFAEYEWSGGFCTEDQTPCQPATLYGAAKDATHRVLAAFARESGFSLGWPRLFLSHGAGEDRRRLVPSVLAALRGKAAPFPVDATAHRDFLHLRDVASALVCLLQSGIKGPVNVASGIPVQIGDVVRGLAAATGTDPTAFLALARPRPEEPRLLSGDNSRLQSLGWAPRYDLQAGLDLTAATT